MAIAGKLGKVVVGETQVVGIKNWSLELSVDSLETTALGDDWKNYIAGLKEWTASSDGDYNLNEANSTQKALQDAFLNGSEVTVKMYVNGTNFYTGTALITSLSVEDPVDDVVSISVEFTGNGAISFDKETA